MKTFRIAFTLTALVAVFLAPSFCSAQTREEATVIRATAVLDEIMALPVKRIPQSLLADAEAIVIVPNVVKGGFVVGVRHGKGVVLVRDEGGGWQAPQFVSLTGGSVGFQAGVQATDVVLVFKTRRSVEGLLRGKFTIGADAAAAAGPVGRQAAAATDGRLQAEIYSYSRSRGLFAGVALDGSVLEIDGTANTLYYRGGGALTPSTEPRPVPQSAVKLIERVKRYAASAPTAPTAPSLAPGAAVAEAPAGDAAIAEARRQLTRSSQQLQTILDPTWQRYLALPSEVYTGEGHPQPQSLHGPLANFDRVAAQPQYRVLTGRPEFQNTHRLLKQYAAMLAPQQPTRLNLPPPPGR